MRTTSQVNPYVAEHGTDHAHERWPAHPERCCEVLVVEMDEHIGDLLADALSDEGYSVCVAREAGAALSLLEQSSYTPDVVLLDVDSFGTPTWRANAILPYRERLGEAVPVIAMTTDSERARKAPPGAQAMVEKPFDLNALLDVVANHLHAPDQLTAS